MNTPEKNSPGGGAWRSYASLAVIIIILVSSAYAVYDLNGGSLDIRDSEIRLVVTGSMDGGPTDYPISTIPVNSLVVIRHIDPDDFDFEIGQVIAYDHNGKVIIHRVIDIDEDKRELRLKGDANRTFEIVPYDDVIGEVVGVSEWMGKVISYLKSNIVLALVFICCSAVILYSIREIIRYLREG